MRNCRPHQPSAGVTPLATHPRHWRRLRRGWRSAILVLSLAPLSCGDDSPETPGAPTPYEWTDDQIVTFSYAPFVWPDGFYHEDTDGGYPYYENTVSVAPPRERRDEWIELCTTSRDEAWAWSESSAVHSAYYRALVSERQTPKYFEFKRVNPADSADVLLSRVHKSSYLDRSMCDRFHVPSDVLGIMRQEPRTSETARELIEYMWSCVGVAHPGAMAMYSVASETDASFVQTILYTSRVNGDYGMCDTIYFGEATFHIAKLTGEITGEHRTIRTITGHCHADGGPGLKH